MPAGHSDLARLTGVLVRRAAETGLPHPHRPWRPALPDRLSAEDLDALAHAVTGDRLRLGLLDRPEAQTQESLELSRRSCRVEDGVVNETKPV